MKPVVRRVLTCLLGPVMVVTCSAGSAVATDRPTWLTSTSEFSPPSATMPSPAMTYDQERVPVGSRITVSQWAINRGMAVRLSVSGLLPGHAYGAHVHTGRCGALPEDSGPHYQNRLDPVRPSTDPAYANPRNEVWLDLTTGPDGWGESFVMQGWSFRPGEANSVVLHEHHTSTEPGHAGQAGDRLACFTVRFR